MSFAARQPEVVEQGRREIEDRGAARRCLAAPDVRPGGDEDALGLVIEVRVLHVDVSSLRMRRSPLLKPWSESTKTAVVSRSIFASRRPRSSSW